MPSINHYEDLHDWITAIKKSCAQSSNWNIIDEWCYSTLTNKQQGAQKLYHLCSGSHIRYLTQPDPTNGGQVTLMESTTCISCGDPVPEGLKMIVMLLESNI